MQTDAIKLSQLLLYFSQHIARERLHTASTVEMESVVDLIIVYAKDDRDVKVPEGYKTLDSELTKGSKKKRVYLCYKKSRTGKPITGLKVMTSDSKRMSIPTGYTALKGELGTDKNVQIAYTKDESLTPITDVMFLVTCTPYLYPQDDWVRIEQDCNMGKDGKYVYLCYRQPPKSYI